jgi:hypothetical protein
MVSLAFLLLLISFVVEAILCLSAAASVVGGFVEFSIIGSLSVVE